MNRTQIESWALSIQAAAKAGAIPEGSFVDLKQSLVVPDKAARGIAGLCNAAQRQPALWLVGLDEGGAVVPHNDVDLADWWPKVSTLFDGAVPGMTEVSCTCEDGKFTALCFQSDQAPYVVQGHAAVATGGGEGRLIPWREGTLTRAIKRHELLRLYDQTGWRGEVNLADARMDIFHDQRVTGLFNYQFRLELHFTHLGGAPLVLPLRRVIAGLLPGSSIGAQNVFPLKMLRVEALDDVGPPSTSQICIQRSGSVCLIGNGPSRVRADDAWPVRLAVRLRDTAGRDVVNVVASLTRVPTQDGLPFWLLSQNQAWRDARVSAEPFPSGPEHNVHFDLGAGRSVWERP